MSSARTEFSWPEDPQWRPNSHGCFFANRILCSTVPTAPVRDSECVWRDGRGGKFFNIVAVRGWVYAARYWLGPATDPVMGGYCAAGLERRIWLCVVPEPRLRVSLQNAGCANSPVAWNVS